ncbi:acyltransferase [Xanthobacter wiegelii]|uniref:acyltransferase n=1 Tax=Xanthobacter wiegelii TaxID=3119913 RepID=UPI0037293E48
MSSPPPRQKSDHSAAIHPLMHWRDGLYSRYFRLVHGRRFARFGTGSRIFFPRDIYNPGWITIGDDVEILHMAFLAATAQTGEPEAALTFGDGCRLGAYNHIYCTRRITFGRKVLTAGNVYVSDNAHDYEAITMPILEQPLGQLKDVTIGDGAWIGANACIIGASIGKGAVVGANSVVTRDVPDFSVAVGAPARIVKRHDPATGLWRKTRPSGEFATDLAETR